MAPIYSFVGETPAILTGLTQGVNAHHVAAPGNPEVTEGSTVVAAPGDSIDTGDLLYPAYFLRDEATGASTVTATEAPEVEAPTAAPDPAPAVVEPVADPAPAPAETAPVDPAPTDPTTATTTDPAPTF